MAVISAPNEERIKAYLEIFVENVVEEYRHHILPELCSPSKYLEKTSTRGDLKPFHTAVIPESLLRINAFERGFSTRLGSTFEECGRLIAIDVHQEAKRGYVIERSVSQAAVSELERQISVFEHVAEAGKPRPDLNDMVQSVLDARRSDDLINLKVTADLYMLAHDGTEYFFEIKSPKPNKGQCIEITQRLLRFHLLRGKTRPDMFAYFAMGYNPYGPNKGQL